MKKLFLLAWPIALAAVSCSNEEVVSVNNDANEIKFTAVANNATRAADSYCNNDMPADFNVWACVDNKQYFADVHYTRDGKTTTYEAVGGEVHFWPQTEEVSFWAAKNHNVDGGSFNWPANGTQPKIVDFTPALTAADQHDLLYAYTVKKRSEATDGKVVMNFRHALSQVVFKAKVTNPTIRVAVDKIEVCRINGKGTFTYPSSVTNDNWDKHDNSAVSENGVGSWTTSGSANFSTGKFTAVEVNNVAVDGKATNLTDETTAHNATPRTIANTLLLLPQTITTWVPQGGKVADESGAYFLVYCTISNYSGVDDGSNIAIWGSKATNEGTTTYTTKAVAIPIPNITWAPGRKYIYTFTFGSKTTGGYDPESGKDVLIPISLDVKVDDFVNVTDHTVWMGPDETPANP